MSAKKKQSDRAKVLYFVYSALRQCPAYLRSLATRAIVRDDDEADSKDSVGKYVKILREVLSIAKCWPEELNVGQNPIVVEQIRRFLRFVAENRLEVGWRFVQLADWMQEARGNRKYRGSKVFTEHLDTLGISEDRWDYVCEFSNLMVSPLVHLEYLLLWLSPPVRVAMGNFEEDAALIGPASDNYALTSLVCNIKNTARRLRNYRVPDEGRKEISVAEQVLGFWQELDEAKYLLVHCEELVAPELYKQTQVAVNVLWDYKEEIVFQLTSALEVPSGPAGAFLPMSMRGMIEAVSARFAKANERRILLEELAGQLEVALGTKDKKKHVKELQHKRKKKKKAPTKTVDKRFTLRPGQVLFDNRDLNVGAGAAVEIATALIKDFGHVVSFQTLDEKSDQAEASEKIRTAIGRIRKAVKSARIPVVIENRKAEGYVMLPSTK